MNFGKLKAALKGLINRKDLTDALAGDFINRAIDEIERTLRITAQEELLVADQWDGTSGTILVPNDYLELSDIFTDSCVLRAVEKPEFFRHRSDGDPAVYIKAGPNWIVKPFPKPGTNVYVQYHAESAQLLADNDENLWTKAAFNAALYGAAALAADYFQMEDQYVARFQGKSDTLVQAIAAQDYDDRWSGTHTMGRVQDRGEY